MEVSQTKGSWGSWSIFFQSEMKLLGGKSLFKEKVFRWQVGKGKHAMIIESIEQ